MESLSQETSGPKQVIQLPADTMTAGPGDLITHKH